MLHFDFEHSVGYWIFAATQDVCCAMNEELAAHGITYRQWETLAWVSKDGEMSQSELAERMSIEAPTLVGVLDRMEPRWLDSAAFRRRTIGAKTDPTHAPGRAAVGQNGQIAHTACAGRATKGLSEEQLRQLRKSCSRSAAIWVRAISIRWTRIGSSDTQRFFRRFRLYGGKPLASAGSCRGEARRPPARP